VSSIDTPPGRTVEPQPALSTTTDPGSVEALGFDPVSSIDTPPGRTVEPQPALSTTTDPGSGDHGEETSSWGDSRAEPTWGPRDYRCALASPLFYYDNIF